MCHRRLGVPSRTTAAPKAAKTTRTLAKLLTTIDVWYSHDVQSHRSCGGRRCRSLRRSPRQRPSITQHQRPALRFCISGLFWNDSSVRGQHTVCIEWGNTAIAGREWAKPIDTSKHFLHEAIENGERKRTLSRTWPDSAASANSLPPE